MRRLPLVALCVCLVACTHVASTPSADPSRTKSARATPKSPLYRRPGDLVVAVKGDWGAGTQAQYDITKQMCAARSRAPFKYVLTVGDNFYDPDGVATNANYYKPEKCLIDGGVVWRAAWGNHDWNHSSTADVLGARHPWYAWSAAGVDFFVLDSNQENSATQTSWLAAQLAGSHARVKIVYFHAPPFSTGSVHPPDATIQRNWVPLFERYGVTLVLSGHEHDYEHFVVGGVHYVITGGGGAVTYGCADKATGLKRCIDSHEFLLVDVRGAVVTVSAIDDLGHEIDRFST